MWSEKGVDKLPKLVLSNIPFLPFKLQLFRGNYDRYIVVTHVLKRPITARYVRLHPKAYHGWMSLRVEFYGCIIGISCYQFCLYTFTIEPDREKGQWASNNGFCSRFFRFSFCLIGRNAPGFFSLCYWGIFLQSFWH